MVIQKMSTSKRTDPQRSEEIFLKKKTEENSLNRGHIIYYTFKMNIPEIVNQMPWLGSK